MPKRTPLPCTPENCGENYERCGITATYVTRKCRCDSCHAADAAYKKENYAKNYEKRREQKRRYYQANREAAIAQERKRYAENREQILERGREYYARNREYLAQKALEYRRNHREEKAEYDRRYNAENYERVRAVRREYYRKNRERIIARHKDYKRRWVKLNAERSRESVRRRRARIKQLTVAEFTQEQLDQRMAYYGNQCYLRLPEVCTGAFDDVEHVKPVSKGGAHMLANLRPACDPCNTRKHNKWPFNPEE